MSEDVKVLKLIELVNKKQTEIKSISSYTYKTNCQFSYNENEKTLNLQAINHIPDLYKIRAFLYVINTAYVDMAPDELKGSFEWCKYPYVSWVLDIDNRINKLSIEKKKKELELLQGRLDKIISPELRAKLEIEAIEKELGL